MNQPGTYASGIFGHGMGSLGEYRAPRRGVKRPGAVRGVGTMPQPGSYNDGALGAIQLRPGQPGSYQDGSLGAIQLNAQPGSYQDGSLGDEYRDGILGQTSPYAAATAAANAARLAQEHQQRASERGTGSKKRRKGMSFSDIFRAGCIETCKSDSCRKDCYVKFPVSGLGLTQDQSRALEARLRAEQRCKLGQCNQRGLTAGQRKACIKTCLQQQGFSGLGMFENVPKWALYAGGAAVLGAGYFLFFKKKR